MEDIKFDNPEKYLYDWIFHYNFHQGKWFAFKREHYKDYFNGTAVKFLKSSKVDVLVEIITALEGNIDNVDSIINGR